MVATLHNLINLCSVSNICLGFVFLPELWQMLPWFIGDSGCKPSVLWPAGSHLCFQRGSEPSSDLCHPPAWPRIQGKGQEDAAFALSVHCTFLSHTVLPGMSVELDATLFCSHRKKKTLVEDTVIRVLSNDIIIHTVTPQLWGYILIFSS